MAWSPQSVYVAECREAQVATGAGAGVTLSLFVLGVLYATYRRNQIRKKFGIPGSVLGDCCQWCWCSACALCQETRTLWHNNVSEGVWLGPSILDHSHVAATRPEYTAPTINRI